MRKVFVFMLRWCIPSLIAFLFLLLPDLIKSENGNFLAPNWLVRIFFTIYLSNSFFGAAKVFSNPDTIKESLNKYRNTDQDTLKITTAFGDSLFTLSTIIVFYYGVTSFYPAIGWLKYLLTSIYSILVFLINGTVYKLKIKHINGDRLSA